MENDEDPERRHEKRSPEVEYRELQSIFRGSMPEVLTLQAALAAKGIESFIPDYNMKTIDPFITGRNVFEVSLQVPAVKAAEAEAEIRSLREGAEERRQEERAGGCFEEPIEESREASDVRQEVEATGRRIRWASVSVITAPVGILWGVKYLVEARPLSPWPSYDRLTRFCLAICFLECLSMAAFMVWGIGQVLR